MNSWIFVTFVSLFVAILVTVDAGLSRTTITSPPKVNDKPVYPKKVTSLKKRPLKTAGKLLALSLPKRTIDAFKNLPADDLDFIKELDKQFKLHGDNIKIKVKRDNTTSTKTSKRTVEGEMGYGHYNSYDADYQGHYPKATFMFYPYSQEDIPGSAIGHQGNYDKTSVTIEPSVSFELKQPVTTGGYENDSPSSAYPQDYYSQSGAADVHQQSPLIVLRIPGPSKYAAHLQSLLQQYLEIRARQYLKILEEAELQKSQQPQHEVAAPQPQYEYSHYDPPAQHQQQPQQQQQIVYQEHQEQPQHEDNYATYQQSHDNYPSVAEVYQKYKVRYQQQKAPEQQHYQEQQTPIEYSSAGMDAQIQPQYYYVPQHPQHTAIPSHSYQSVYFIAMPAHQPSYAAQSSDHQQESSSYPHQLVEQSAYGDLKQSDSPPISENNPRPTHTKVVFTHSTERTKNYSPTYPLPSIQPFDHHLPSPTPIYEKYQQQQQQNYEPSQEIDYHRSEQQVTSTNQHQQQDYQPSEEKVVSITQRPFNYHAHSVKNRSRSNSKRDAFQVPKSNKKTIRNLQEDHKAAGVTSLR